MPVRIYHNGSRSKSIEVTHAPLIHGRESSMATPLVRHIKTASRKHRTLPGFPKSAQKWEVLRESSTLASGTPIRMQERISVFGFTENENKNRIRPKRRNLTRTARRAPIQEEAIEFGDGDVVWIPQGSTNIPPPPPHQPRPRRKPRKTFAEPQKDLPATRQRSRNPRFAD